MKKFPQMLLLIASSMALTACDFWDFLTNTPVTNVILDQTSLEFTALNESKKLTATVKPTTATNKKLEWTTADSGIATVTATGNVTSKYYGITKIRATATDGSGKFAECLVDIKENGAVLDYIEVVNPDNVFNTGDDFRPSKIVAHYLSGTSRDVTAKAKFTGYNPFQAGVYTITASYEENSITKTTTYTITVNESGLNDGKTKMQQSYEDYAKNNVSNIDYTPSIGEPKLLIIPIWFNDSNYYINSDKKETVRHDIELAYFGTNEQTGWRSVKTYYEEESHGLLRMTGTVSDWYAVTSNSSYYGSDSARTSQLVKTATDWYFSKNPSDSRKNYDTNNDGRLDGVMLIYGCPNYLSLANNSLSNLWAYCYWIQTNYPNKDNPTPNVYFWASYDFMYGANASSRTGHSYGYGSTNYCVLDTHTYIHEMGHCLGLDDYYDYSDLHYSPAGSLTMQDCNVGGHDPYSTMALGWTKPYIPDTSLTMTIKPFQESGDMILLTPSWNTFDSPFDEYLLLEYYTPTGLNAFDKEHAYGSREKLPSDSGIRVWHIDARLAYPSSSTYSITRLSSNAKDTQKSFTHAFSNTYNDGTEATMPYLSPIGTFTLPGSEITYDASNFDLVHYVRNSKVENFKTKSSISNTNMFKKGDSFSMNDYHSQFVCGTLLDSLTELGWSFKIKDITSEKATIELTKAE